MYLEFKKLKINHGWGTELLKTKKQRTTDVSDIKMEQAMYA